MDFTLPRYHQLLSALLSAGYSFQPFSEYLANPLDQAIILRHDVDRLPANSLATAEMEHAAGIRGSDYFRMVPESYDETIIHKLRLSGTKSGIITKI